MRRQLAVGAVALGLLTALSTPAVASVAAGTRSPVKISEIYYNSPGPDRGGNASLNEEWVKLHNRSGRAVTLTGWTLRDAAHHVYRFGTYRLKAHGYVKIHTGHGRDAARNRYWDHSWYIWNNNGDTAVLKNDRGAVKSRCSYSDPSESYSYKTC